MPDLSAGFDIPNPFGLLASDFSYDLDGYRAALGFLSDLASGTEEAEALKGNGGDPSLLVAWRRSDKFRRVYAKCRAAGEVEREHAAQTHADPAVRQREDDGGSVGQRFAQRFIPLDEAPTTRTIFSLRPPRGSWGQP